MEVTLGGDRLGGGKKNKIHLREYERSNHNIGYKWRSTMAPGTLVPFMSEIALPGTTMDIDLNGVALTKPTIGPLYGEYKMQIDVFQLPIRLYNARLHMNELNIGRDMSKVYLPQIDMKAGPIDPTKNPDNQQINPSCIFSFLDIRGLGQPDTPGLPQLEARRSFNAVKYLGYWDIYKNYYANKQEEIGAVIHQPAELTEITLYTAETRFTTPDEVAIDIASPYAGTGTAVFTYESEIVIDCTDPGLPLPPYVSPAQFNLHYKINGGTTLIKPIIELFEYIEVIEGTVNIIISRPIPTGDLMVGTPTITLVGLEYTGETIPVNPEKTEPLITTFPLTNIDDMRMSILQAPTNVPFVIDESTPAPYGLPLESAIYDTDYRNYSKLYNLEGLALKTYNSDLFNNWVSTEWIDGTNGVNEVTKVNVEDDSFFIDELMLKNKIYNMLMRIAVSGGSYDDWQDVTYTHERQRLPESPIYLGGQIRNIIFQEVISNAASTEQPLGTLAGRGKMGGMNKGGHVIVKVNEPSYIMAIVSITPYIDYSQGNKWDSNLKNMDDFHKPALDEIGFQDLITDQMAFWDTAIDEDEGTVIFKSAGKQPAWINYMTNVNVVRGNFAVEDSEMFMTLNRKYTAKYTENTNFQKMPSIADLTTYIDPSKFNHIFAETRRDAQNFWVQIAADITARRKMSAKVMPNL